MKWLKDSNGNQCSVEYFGSEEAAQKALDSLKNCDNCINCSDCSECSGCSNCSGYYRAGIDSQQSWAVKTSLLLGVLGMLELLLAEAIGLLKESREFIGGDWRERRDDFLERSEGIDAPRL